MRLYATALVLACSSCAIAQTNTAAATVPSRSTMPQATSPGRRIRQNAPPGKSAAATPADTPMVTLKGVCKDRLAKTPCETVVTREDLDRFMSTFGPNVSETARGAMAVQYARTLAFASVAEQQGLSKSPVLAKEMEAQVKLLRARILSTALLQNLQSHLPPLTETEISAYYAEHRDQYEQAQVRRVAVPVVAPTEDGRALKHDAIKAEMEDVRARAVAGEDVNELLKGAYQHLHIQATPPVVSSTLMRRAELQGDEARVFDLTVGGVTPVLDLPAAYAFYQLESRNTAPIEMVRAQVEAALRQKNMQRQVSQFDKQISAKFNLDYLDMKAAPDLFAPTVLAPAASRARRSASMKP